MKQKVLLLRGIYFESAYLLSPLSLNALIGIAAKQNWHNSNYTKDSTHVKYACLTQKSAYI